MRNFTRAGLFFKILLVSFSVLNSYRPSKVSIEDSTTP